MCEWIDKWLANGWSDLWMDNLANGYKANGWMDGQINGLRDGLTNGCMKDKWIDEVLY